MNRTLGLDEMVFNSRRLRRTRNHQAQRHLVLAGGPVRNHSKLPRPYFFALVRVLSSSEARVETGVGIALHDLGNGWKWGGWSHRARNFRLATFCKSSA